MFPEKEPLFHRVRRYVKNIPYNVKCFFKPFNVVKIQNLDRTWHDRDAILFHAAFQVLVDFIELEKPFMSWDDKRYHGEKRSTHIASMKAFIEEHYGPASDDYKEVRYLAKKEILWVYEWYKSRAWDDSNWYWDDWEAEKQFDAKCDDMLHRVIAWRHHYWT